MPIIQNKNALVDIELKIDGSVLAVDPNTLVEINVRKSVNRITRANVQFLLRSIPVDEAYAFSEKKELKPGKDIEIKVGYIDETKKSVFNGIIVAHGLERDEDNQISVVLECAHKAIKMTTSRKNDIFLKKNDTAIISGIINNYGIPKTIDSTSVQHEEMIQFHCTDWDFVITRANACGMVLYNNDKKIEIEKPSLSASPAIEVKDREALLSFSTTLHGTNLFGGIEAKTWNYKTQSVISSKSKKPSSKLGGDLRSGALYSTFNSSDFSLLASSNMAQNELKEWANAKHSLSELSFIRGTIVIAGTADANCGKTVKLSNISRRFNGNAYIGSLEHSISLSKWTTEIQLGYDFEWYHERENNIDNKGAGGLIPVIKGLQTGVVVSVGDDPENQYRVKVKLTSLMKDCKSTVYARIANFYATNQAGSVFMPEVDDEVILGFIDQDPRNIVILGSLYSSKKKPPLTVEKKNETKGIVTKNKMKLTFDEKDKIISIETPGGNTVTLDDKGKKIELADSNNNKISMDKSGIKLSTVKDIVLDAKGDVKISAMKNIKGDAKVGVEMKGVTVKSEAQTMFEAKGNAGAKIQSTGILQIQGSLVKIN